MTELARFHPAAAKHQPTFVFERASLALIATWRDRCTHTLAADLPLDSEWRDPAAYRVSH
ncbi:hypothetical protein C6P61_17005 [Malikia spinosa]|uniref:Uncharacterized protein n=1 Tax=Malikia spinosa TaxID=86180 RepID=A0A2S9KA84_9BURK|nr:hypothetical protein [Malikia spinosa]PRD67327.1 hypothetical protein C6P61_17005 [Malikia spinosa]